MIKSLFDKTGIAMILALSSTVCAAESPGIPMVKDYQNFTGDSFEADWNSVSGSTDYLLNVFQQDKGKLTKVTETFATVGVSDGTVSNIPANWAIKASETIQVNGENRLLLTEEGDYLYFRNPDGVINDLTFFARIVNTAATPNNNNLPKLQIEVFNNAGELMMTGAMGTLYFTYYEDLVMREAFTGWPENAAAIKFTLLKDSNKEMGDIVVSAVNHTYYERNYVLRNTSVAAPPYKVTGLDAEQVYYYYVQARNADGVSEPSDIVTVDGFLVPTGVNYTLESPNSYTAYWDETPKADGYIITHHSITKSESGEKVVLNEDFAKATEGTYEEPVAVSSFDDYTSQAGWKGTNIAIANGMIGTLDGAFMPPTRRSSIQTPEMDLSGAGGVYTVTIKAKGTPGDVLSLYRVGYVVDGALNIHKVTFDENGYAEESWTMDDGAEGMTISIEENKLKKFFIDEISIKQQVANTVDMMREDFAKATEGTYEEPVAVSSFDDYTSQAGWKGTNIAIASGMIGTLDGAFMPPTRRSSIQTPEMDLSGAGGVYTVTIKAKGTPGDVLSLYRVGYVVDGALNIHKVTFDENGYAEESWTMDDGAEGMTISIEENKLKKFFIDDFVITQTGNDNVIKTYLGTVVLEGKSSTSFTFADLTPGASYGFEVQAKRTDRFGLEEQTERTELQVVTLSATTSVEIVEAKAAISYADNQLTVTSQEAQTIAVYDINGRTVFTGTVPVGKTTLPFTLSSNIYIVHLGQQAFKLLVK